VASFVEAQDREAEGGGGGDRVEDVDDGSGQDEVVAKEGQINSGTGPPRWIHPPWSSSWPDPSADMLILARE
jgi:hypothetical protein